MLASWKENYDKPRQHIKKQRYHFSNKGPYNQTYGFPSSHVWIWALNHKEGWTLKNWCIWIVVLEKTLESPFDCKEINQSILKEINFEYSLEGLPTFWTPDVNSRFIGEDPDAGKDWKPKEKRVAKDEIVIGLLIKDMNLSKLWETVKDREAWSAAVHGVTKSQMWLSYWTTTVLQS